ncbi:helix-turn-helix transcriptional regulator [Luteimonas sp. B3_2_R+30]|uniref:Helix-turn-helix transcriptional regulator n=2 Tax=Luteimonas salinilitoris TaxID=3237697 RepID=A0ABV4HQX0_9GAMM
MSYISDMHNAPEPLLLPHRIGNALRAERKRLGLTQADVARRARLRRQKIIQIEQGAPGVAIAAYAAAMQALGLEPELRPARVDPADYPQLKRLLWNQPGIETLDERDALALYERHWDMVDADRMPPHERALLDRLVRIHGHGILHV